MSKHYLDTGRTVQKLKTRLRILSAAQHLLDKNEDISLEKVAEKADISRATIYRYFPNNALLVSEVAINIKTPSIDVLLEEVDSLSLSDALLFAQQHYNELAQNNEYAFRNYLSVVLSESLENNNYSRGSRRPLLAKSILKVKGQHLNASDRNKLGNALALLCGIEPHIVNTDVNKLTKKASNELLEWMLLTLIKGINNPD